MKKKLLLLTVLVMAFICLFAISISAETVISENNIDASGDIVADVLTDLGNDHHLLSVDISYTDTNGQVKNGKFYYETSYWSQRSMRQIKIVYVPADFDMSQMIYIFDKADYNNNGEYTIYELTKLYEGGGGFKMYSYSSYEDGTFADTVNIISSIQRVSYSKYFVKLADGGFGSKAPNVTTITYNGREPIEGALIISPLIDEIFGGSFGGDGGSETSNSIVTPFTKLIFEDRETSVSFGTYCFTRNIIEEIYFGKGTYGLGDKNKIALLFGNDYANGEGATLKTVILHKDAKISSGEISWNVGSYDVVVLGTESESKEYYVANHQSKLPCAKSVTYNPCYYGHTSEDDYNCATALVCTVCRETLEEAGEHTIIKAWEYENGYLSKGVCTSTCTNDGCKYTEAEEAPALISSKGFSTPTENGKKGLALGFEVNEEALSAYRAVGKTISFGAYVAGYENLKNDSVTDIYDYEKAIKADVTIESASYYAIKVTGFNTEEQLDAQLCLGAYIIENGVASYLQAGEAEEGSSFLYTTYNLAYANSSNK